MQRELQWDVQEEHAQEDVLVAVMLLASTTARELAKEFVPTIAQQRVKEYVEMLVMQATTKASKRFYIVFNHDYVNLFCIIVVSRNTYVNVYQHIWQINC